MVMKVKLYGGFFVFSETARLDSGLFSVCIFPENSIPKLIKYAVSGLLRRGSRIRGVTHLSGRQIEIRSLEPVAVQADGTYLGTTPVSIGLVPAFVPVVVPRNSKQ